MTTAYHPQMDGQTERFNLVMEDMLWVYVQDYLGSQGDHIALVEFDYNNKHHSIIRITPFKALYDRPYCSWHIGWSRDIELYWDKVWLVIPLRQWKS